MAARSKNRNRVLDIRLATRADAEAIATLSRTEIEYKLPWRWTPERVRKSIEDPAVNVVVAFEANVLAAFGIMLYREEAAHLQLLAVRPGARRRGVGSAVLLWLEDVARVAGVRRLSLECRRDNEPAIAFYGRHGYTVHATIPGMYLGLEDGVRLEKRLGKVAPVDEKS